jgi:hypothetical protein
VLHRVALVRTDVSEERIASIIVLHSVRQLLVIANAVPSSHIRVTLIMEAIVPPKRRILKEPHSVDIPEDGIIRSHRHEHLQSYIALTVWAL